jgi:hypothetical protein
LLFFLDYPDKENIPPDPGSDNKATPIKEANTEKSLAVSGEASDGNGIPHMVYAFDSQIAVDIVLIVTFYSFIYFISFYFGLGVFAHLVLHRNISKRNGGNLKMVS